MFKNFKALEYNTIIKVHFSFSDFNNCFSANIGDTGEKQCEQLQRNIETSAEDVGTII